MMGMARAIRRGAISRFGAAVEAVEGREPRSTMAATGLRHQGFGHQTAQCEAVFCVVPMV